MAPSKPTGQHNKVTLPLNHGNAQEEVGQIYVKLKRSLYPRPMLEKWQQLDKSPYLAQRCWLGKVYLFSAPLLGDLMQIRRSIAPPLCTTISYTSNSLAKASATPPWLTCAPCSRSPRPRYLPGIGASSLPSPRQGASENPGFIASFAGRGQMLDGRVLGASQVEYNPFGKPPVKREHRLLLRPGPDSHLAPNAWRWQGAWCAATGPLSWWTARSAG